MTKKGFTLVEVLAAVVVLTIGIIAVHQGFSRCIAAIRHSEEKLYCSFILERKAVELLISSPKKALEDSRNLRDEDAAAAGYSLKDTTSIVTREEEEFVLHQLEAEGPTGTRLSAPLLTPAPEKDKR